MTNYVKLGGVPKTELNLRRRLVEQVRLRYRPKVRRLVRMKGCSSVAADTKNLS